MQWLRFAWVQFIMLAAAVRGFVVLIIPCVFRQWEDTTQSYIPEWQQKAGLPPKTIKRWRWKWLNVIYGNDEDGVVGPQWYNPTGSRWGAYMWSAWRNSTDNLKYVFEQKGGPWYEWKSANGKWYFQAGWNSSGLPVISAGRV